jgi:hypothetical protein
MLFVVVARQRPANGKDFVRNCTRFPLKQFVLVRIRNNMDIYTIFYTDQGNIACLTSKTDPFRDPSSASFARYAFVVRRASLSFVL